MKNKNIRVLLLGSGVMGKGIASILSYNNDISKVDWLVRNKDEIQFSEYIKKYLKIKARRGEIDKENLSNFLKKINIIKSASEIVEETDFVIEAVSENLQIKIELIKKIEPFLSEKTIYTTNTSSLSITELSSFYKWPENLIGLHFFNPAPTMNLNEIVIGLLTSNITVSETEEFSKILHKRPIVLKESPGFVVNRMLIPMINEAISILYDGICSAKDIDIAMRYGANHPIGPLAFADLIGNDVCLLIMESLFDKTKDSKYRPHPLLRNMVHGKLLGQKTGKGFYEYNKKKS